MTNCSRIKGYCFKNNGLLFPCCLSNFLQFNNSETGYRNANSFPKRVVEILKGLFIIYWEYGTGVLWERPMENVLVPSTKISKKVGVPSVEGRKSPCPV